MSSSTNRPWQFHGWEVASVHHIRFLVISASFSVNGFQSLCSLCSSCPFLLLWIPRFLPSTLVVSKTLLLSIIRNWFVHCSFNHNNLWLILRKQRKSCFSHNKLSPPRGNNFFPRVCHLHHTVTTAFLSLYLSCDIRVCEYSCVSDGIKLLFYLFYAYHMFDKFPQ